MNVVLVGYRCSGKTSVGKTLAGELGRGFLDTDVLLEENAGCSIETIASRDGWDYFRALEKETIEQVSGRDHLVIATGGGVVLDRDNMKNLKRNGFIVWLKGDAVVLRERMNREEMSGNIRPSLTGTDPLKEIKQVLDARTPFYEQAGDLIVDTTSLSVPQVVAAIRKDLPEGLKE